MARPVDREKRVELARQAVDVLGREGLHISTTRLAEALELKRPTLLYYFPDRAIIVEAALQDLLAEQARFVVERMAEHEHPIDQLYARICAVHEFHHGAEERVVFLTQALAAGGAGRMKHIIDIGNAAFERQRQVLEERIREGVRLGIVHDCDAQALTRLARSVVDGLMVQRVMTGCELGPVHEFLWEHLLAPLKKDPCREVN